MSPLLLAYLACPILLWGIGPQIAFLLLAAPAAAYLAHLGQGSWARILGAALGASARDLVLGMLVAWRWVPVSNPDFLPDCALVAMFLAASGAAIMTTLTPYTGRMVPLMAALGAVGGQCVIAWLPAGQTPLAGWWPC